MGGSTLLTRFVDPRGVMLGEYRIEQPIAWGGMGVIYLARNPLLGSRAVAKVLREELAVHPGIAERFLEEASVVSQIRHPNIVQVYDFVSLPDGRPCILMEYLDGETLAVRASRGPMAVNQARPILLQVAAALGATHARGIVHRDLKAENVLLVAREGRDDYVKLLDFGLAKGSAIAAGLSLPGTLAGTPYYMAPEQVRGEPVDVRTDVYSLGVLAYRLLVGRFPHEGGNVEEIMYKQVYALPDLGPLDASLKAALGKALAKAPKDRFASAVEFAQAISDGGAGEPAAPPAPAPHPPAGPADWMHAPTQTNPELPKVDLSVPPSPPAVAAHPASIAEQLDAMTDVFALQPKALAVAPLTPEPGPPAQPWSPAGASPVAPAPVPAPVPAATVPAPAPVPDPVPAVPVVAAAAPARAMPIARQRTSPLASATAAAKHAESASPSRVLERYMEVSDRDHYAFLGVPGDSRADVVVDAIGRAERELGEARERAPAPMRPQFAALIARLGRAQRALVDVEARAAYDAKLGNYQGIARCLQAGLSMERLDRIHAEWVARSPDRPVRAAEYLAAAERHAKAGDLEKAREALEHALEIDPLSPDLQRRLAVLDEA